MNDLNMDRSLAPDPVLGPEWSRQEVCIKGAEAVGRSVVVEQVGEVEGGPRYVGLCE